MIRLIHSRRAPRSRPHIFRESVQKEVAEKKNTPNPSPPQALGGMPPAGSLFIRVKGDSPRCCGRRRRSRSLGSTSEPGDRPLANGPSRGVEGGNPAATGRGGSRCFGLAGGRGPGPTSRGSSSPLGGIDRTRRLIGHRLSRGRARLATSSSFRPFSVNLETNRRGRFPGARCSRKLGERAVPLGTKPVGPV